MIGHRGSGESYEYNTRVRDKIKVWYIAGMSAVVVHPRNMIMMGSLFPLAVVSFEEIPVPLMDEAPGLWFNTPVKEIIISRLSLSSGRFMFLDIGVLRCATNIDRNQHQHPCYGITYTILAHTTFFFRPDPCTVSPMVASCSLIRFFFSILKFQPQRLQLFWIRVIVSQYSPLKWLEV